MFITALDLGTSQIKALVAELKKDNQLSLLNVFKVPSSGLRKGEIIAIEDAVQSIRQAIDGIKKINKSAAKNIYINVGGPNVRIQNSKGIVAVSRADNEIYQEDIDRVIKASQAVNLGPNRMILHTLTREFIVDGIDSILDPLGMVGNRLEVNSVIVDVFKPTINNLIKTVELAGGKIGGLIYCPLASSRSVLTKNQRELGVVMIDIGSGSVGISVYEENKLLHAVVFPIGSCNITNDLAIGLRCSVKTAEQIKLSIGYALAKEVSNKEKIDLCQLDETLKSVVARRFIAEIIEIRLAEIFELVNNELKLIGKMGQLPAGVVLTGGGAKIPGIIELVKHELKLPVQIGSPETTGMEIANNEFEALVADPEFAASVGLLIWSTDQSLKEKSWLTIKRGWFSKIFSHFLP